MSTLGGGSHGSAFCPTLNPSQNPLWLGALVFADSKSWSGAALEGMHLKLFFGGFLGSMLGHCKFGFAETEAERTALAFLAFENY